MINDGYFSASAESRDIDLPPIQPQLAIMAPQRGYSPFTGKPLHLYGATVGGNVELEQEEELVWLVDGEEAARGCEAWIAAPAPGRHVIELQRRGERSRPYRNRGAR